MEDNNTKKPRKVYTDTLSGMIVLQALIEFTHEVAEKGTPDNRSQFDAILCRVHNAAAPENQQKEPAYFAISENSLRVSQKFSQIKTKMKDAGQEIHISLPRRSRTFGAKQLAKLQENSAWDTFAALNKAAQKKKK